MSFFPAAANSPSWSSISCRETLIDSNQHTGEKEKGKEGNYRMPYYPEGKPEAPEEARKLFMLRRKSPDFFGLRLKRGK